MALPASALRSSPRVVAASNISPSFGRLAWSRSGCETRPLARALRVSHHLQARSSRPYAGAQLRSFNSTASPLSPEADTNPVDAIVVGAGPAGLAVVGNLLEQLPNTQSQIWVDPHYASGRIGARYREVPSNTKVKLFLQYATAVTPFKEILDKTPAPNAASVLSELPQDEGCQLSHAADLCVMLSDGLKQFYPQQVKARDGRLISGVLDQASETWKVTFDDETSVITKRLVLCTGSSPISSPASVLSGLPASSKALSDLTEVNLDTALQPTVLEKQLSSVDPVTVAVVGASHSAILVLMNLYKLATTTHQKLQIKWFTRHTKLKYAKEMDGGWILYDNTGLKGQAAQWARENLEEGHFETSQVRDVITRLWTSGAEGKEKDVYNSALPDCTHIVQAIGFKHDPLPELSVITKPGTSSETLSVKHDETTGRFLQGTKVIPGLFGAGIAFPERVKDPAGNVEHAVGLWKFMRFLKKAVPRWV